MLKVPASLLASGMYLISFCKKSIDSKGTPMIQEFNGCSYFPQTFQNLPISIADLRLLPGKSYFQATRPGRPGENGQK